MSNKPVRPAPDLLTPPDSSEASSSVGQSPARNPAPPASTSLRGIVDALLQGSLVELFQAYGVALAPLPRDLRTESEGYPELSAVISFTSASEGSAANAAGKLSLSVPVEVFDGMHRDLAVPTRHADWGRELLNQLMGRFKNRLLPYGARLQAGLPASIGRDALEEQLSRAVNLRVYRARTLRGQIVATLDGTLKESELVYVGPTTDATEGELILF